MNNLFIVFTNEKISWAKIYVLSNLLETPDPFTSDDPFKSDPFAQFKTVSFADPFSSDPFEVQYCTVLFAVINSDLYT